MRRARMQAKMAHPATARKPPLKLHQHANCWAISALILGTATGAAWAGPPDQPFKARVQTQEVLDNNPGRCPGSNLLGMTTGTGTASHMGAVTLQATDCPLTQDFVNFFVSNGRLTLTAANGDQLNADYWGTLLPIPGANPPLHAINGSFSVTGGTGRFSGAHGGGSLQGRQDLATLKGVYEVDGRLSYGKK